MIERRLASPRDSVAEPERRKAQPKSGEAAEQLVQNYNLAG
jgi:hypothetical protein